MLLIHHEVYLVTAAPWYSTTTSMFWHRKKILILDIVIKKKKKRKNQFGKLVSNFCFLFGLFLPKYWPFFSQIWAKKIPFNRRDLSQLSPLSRWLWYIKIGFVEKSLLTENPLYLNPNYLKSTVSRKSR